MSDTDGFEATLADRFEADFGADAETAAAAAERAANYRADWDEDLDAETVLEAVESAEAAHRGRGFVHRFNLAVGDLAAANEDCTDSRAYRLSGFGDLAADPDQGT